MNIIIGAIPATIIGIMVGLSFVTGIFSFDVARNHKVLRPNYPFWASITIFCGVIGFFIGITW